MAEPDAAVAIVHTGGAADAVLLILRAERAGDSWSGHWSFPGGRREPRDSDPLCTALRELDEECGIRLRREHLEAPLAACVARRRVGRFLLVAPFVFHVPTELPVRLDSREAVDALWVPLSVLRDAARHRLQPVPGLPPEVLFPAVELHGPPLWGFTYRLVTDWLGLGPGVPVEQAGFQFASALLDFLLSRGLTCAHGWVAREDAKVARVTGAIPVRNVLAWASQPTPHIPRLNRVEVRPNAVRLLGLAFEEYRIQASGH
jgi:8-oxo-dGTP diphosphatase